eukprot:4329118-Karenia_brevis.AAC.1
MQYHLQAQVPEDSMMRKEFGLIHRMYHLPCNSLSRVIIRDLPTFFNFPVIQTIESVSIAAKSRFFLDHRPALLGLVKVLDSIWRLLPLISVNDGVWAAAHFTTPPLARVIVDCYFGKLKVGP